MVAGHLGNTRTVCKKYYVHPGIVDHYANNTINKYFNQPEQLNCDDTATNLNADEQVLMKMLTDMKTAVVAL